MGPSSSNLCNNRQAVAFVHRYLEDCRQIARKLNVPVENILGLAAMESQYGAGRIARVYNNYFSMHAPAIFQIGDAPALGNPKVRVAKFASFLQSGQSFAARFGKKVQGISDPKAFSKMLVQIGFNNSDSASGGRSGFASYLTGIIKTVKIRMECPQ